MADTRDIAYLVLPDATNPALLARVRWPDVFQAMSPARPYWQDDPGLFDLPYDPNSTPLSSAEAAALAAEWGGRLVSDDTDTSVRSLIRRMPANWSNLSPAEIGAWSIEFAKPAKPAALAEGTSRGRTTSRRRPWRRRRTPALERPRASSTSPARTPTTSST